MLTFHKSQGRGYDIVYLMTAEDDCESKNAPWGQNIRIINVAVSRAKKELHVITSRIWMPQYIQEKLIGAEAAAVPLPKCITPFSGESAEKKFYAPVGKDKQPPENFCIGRLCQWVYNWYERGENNFGEFGFRGAGEDSVFDGLYDGAVGDNREILIKAVEKKFGSENVRAAPLNDTDSTAQQLLWKLKEDDQNAEQYSAFESCLDLPDFLFACDGNEVVITENTEQFYKGKGDWSISSPQTRLYRFYHYSGKDTESNEYEG